MKLNDPIPESTFNRWSLRFFGVGAVLGTIAFVLHTIGSDASRGFGTAAICFVGLGWWTYYYLSSEAGTDDYKIAYNKSLEKNGSELPKKHVGTHKWAYWGLGLAVGGFVLLFAFVALGIDS